MRWNVFGTYWHSDDYADQLYDTIGEYLSGKRQVMNLLNEWALAQEIRLGRQLTKKELMALYLRAHSAYNEFRKEQGVGYDDYYERQDEVASWYYAAQRGDKQAAISLWSFLEDDDRLKFTLHLWELRQVGELDAAVWAVVLKETWLRGKTGCLLLKAKLSPKTVVKMFRLACPSTLMQEQFGTSTEAEVFSTLPEKVRVWRGVSSASRHSVTGYSWTLDCNQAVRFAHRAAMLKKGQPLLVEAEISRSAFLALFAQEQELVLDPTKSRLVFNTQSVVLPPEASKPDNCKVTKITSQLMES